MKKVLLIFALAAVMPFVTAQEPDQGPTYINPQYTSGFKVAEGDKAPDFCIEMTDGSIINSADLRGKVVLIDFWATWCGSCVKELHEGKETIIKHFEGRDFVFLPIASMTGGDTPEMIKEWAGEYPIPMGMDNGEVVYNSMIEAVGLPRKILIDKDGTVLAVTRGAFKGLKEAVIARAEEALNK